MLAAIPSGLYGRVGVVLSALIVVLSVIGLTMHKDFYAGVRRRDFFCFYTNLSNLLVLLYFSLAAPRLYASGVRAECISSLEFSLMMSIMLTFCVFHLILFPAIRKGIRKLPRTREFYIVYADNLIVHYLVPWLVLTYWLLCTPGKYTLSLSDALGWTMFPLIYVIITLLAAPRRGIIEETGSPYPYPFLDVQVFGIRRVLGTCASLYALCAAAGVGVIALTKLLFRLFGGGHALLLI